MPIPALVLLIAILVPYIAVMGWASVRVNETWRGKTAPEDRSEWPPVTVVLDARKNALESSLQSILDAEYAGGPPEVLYLCNDPSKIPSPSGKEVQDRLQMISCPESSPDSSLKKTLDSTKGEVVLLLSADCTVSPGWVRTMVQHSSPDTPVVVGPALIAHENRFFPRLQALYRIWTSDLVLGVGHSTHLSREILNHALCTKNRGTTQRAMARLRLLFSSRPVPPEDDAPEPVIRDPKAAAFCPPASLSHYLTRESRVFRRTLRGASWSSWMVLSGLWLTHVALLVSCMIAGIAPAWRQPTLLALLAKMGGDALLSVPAARQYQQQTLTRSFVPAELFYLVSIPLIGVKAAIDLSTSTGS